MTCIKDDFCTARKVALLKLTTSIQRQAGRARSAEIAHIRERGLNATIIARKRLREFHVTIEPLPDEPPAALIRRLHAFLSAHNAVIVRQEVFGLRSAAARFFKRTAALSRAITWPIVWAEGEPTGKGPIAGIHAFAISGAEVQWLFLNGRPVASVFSDGFARHLLLSGITPSTDTEDPAEATDEVFDLIATQLSRSRMDWKHVARTSFYLDRILNWYGDFNLVRKDAFDRFEIYSQRMPASTGVGAANLAGLPLTVSAWAVQPLRLDAGVASVISPLQCSARDYGSCFSRAVEINTPDLRRLLISGTASISPDGATEHRRDIWGQMVRTFDVVEAILSSRSMRWTDVSRATVYLKHAHDACAFDEFLAAHCLNLPLVVTRAEVCRDDLLFEIELDAVISTKPQRNV